jgi:hypothetical protein
LNSNSNDGSSDGHFDAAIEDNVHPAVASLNDGISPVVAVAKQQSCPTPSSKAHIQSAAAPTPMLLIPRLILSWLAAFVFLLQGSRGRINLRKTNLDGTRRLSAGPLLLMMNLNWLL